MKLKGAALACAVALWLCESESPGAYWTRAQVARRLRGAAAARLMPHEIEALIKLVDAGLIDAAKSEASTAVVAFRWEYRALPALPGALRAVLESVGVVGVRVWQRADKDRFSDFPTVGSLARSINASDQAVVSAIERLRAVGALQRVGGDLRLGARFPEGLK